MFNLDEAFAQWRRRAELEGLGADEIEELEAHLRDEVERQVQAGADIEHAFAAALRLLGDPAELRQEFARANGANQTRSARRQRWARSASFIGAFAILTINTWALVIFELSAFERVMGAYAVAATVLFVGCAPFLRAWLPSSSYMHLLQAMKVLVLFVALMPILLLLSAFEVIKLETGSLGTVFIWLLVAGVAFSVIALDFNSGSGSDGNGAGGVFFTPNFPPGTTGSARGIKEGPPLSKSLRGKLALDSEEVLKSAREEAARLGHDFIGTEHLLLGVLKIGKGAVSGLLTSSQLYFESVRQEIERLIAPQKCETPAAAIPLTPRAQKALQIAGNEARRLRQPLVTADHLVLGLILEGSGLGAMILKRMGLRAEQIRSVVARI